MKKPQEITAATAREFLSYDPESGAFQWSKNQGASRAGQIAGNNTPAKNGYLRVGIFGGRYLAHRLAWLYMTGAWPQHEIDHINGNRADNRWVNLRAATAAQNSYNQRAQAKSGYKGVYANTGAKQSWSAKICKDGKRYYLGSFNSEAAAHAAYIAKAHELFGEFARAA